MSILAYLLGFLAAFSNAWANVLQRAANRDENEGEAFSYQMVKNLLRSKLWLGGIGCMTASFFLQATGLGFGTLSAVEPLLVLELPITMIVSRFYLGSRIGSRSWASIVGMTVSTIGLIAFLGPGRGKQGGISWFVYAIAIAVTAGAVLTCYVLGVRWSDRAKRAAILGIGTGTAYGLAASLTKGMTEQFSSGGIAGIFTSWQLYAAIVTGAFAVWMHQNAVNSATLVVAQPGITLADPYVAIVWGAAVFAEPMRGGLWVLGAVATGIGLTVSAVELSRSTATDHTEVEQERDQTSEDEAQTV